MMRRNISEILTLAAAALLAAGCAGSIDPQGYCDGTVSFAVDVAGSIEEVKAGTKAGDAQTISSFKVAAYNNNGSDHAQFIDPNTNVTVSGTSATTNIRWTKPYAKVFYAYANLPASGAGVTPAYDGQTLTFDALPSTVANQTDVLLAAKATDGGSTRTAALTFKHALASVTFNAGQMQNVASVNSITVKGVYSKGSVKQSSDGTFGAWSGTTETQDITQTGLSVTPPESGSIQIGSTLLLIPQSGDITIELGVTMTGGGTKTLTGTVSVPTDDNAWKAGYATTYTIGYTESKDLNFTANAVAWGTATAINTPQMETALPDPRYWVDLGMVSDNGKKMYVAKYDVDTFDPETGIATFKTDGTLGTKYSTDPDDNDLSKIKRSQEGQSCRLMSLNEEIALLNINNFNSQESNGITTLTSKMNGNTISFTNGLRLVWSNSDSYYYNYYIQDVGEYLWENDGSDGSLRLICETDEILTPIGLKAYCAHGGSLLRESFSYDTPVNDGETYDAGVSNCRIRPTLVYNINNKNYEYWNRDGLTGKYLINGENVGFLYYYGSTHIEITSPNYNLRIGITVLNDDVPF